ncbi:MAG: AhpC/TSA family protein [Ignavibacteria bacterium]|nr:AhpC/TSA family protein [Ignavibacteria bacterium]
MMIRILLTVIVLACSSIIFPQKACITVTGAAAGRAYVYSVQGEKTILVDSIAVTPGGEMVWNISAEVTTGIYRIVSGRQFNIDFIYDGQDIHIASTLKAIVDSARVPDGECNKAFYQFIRLNRQYKTKSELLSLMLARYPSDDEFYTEIKQRMLRLNDDYKRFIVSVAPTGTTSFIARYIRSAQLPVIPVSEEKQLTWLRMHALDMVDFSDAGLVRSDAFANKAIEYLMYYRNPQLPKEQLENEFRIAIDTLVRKARINGVVYSHLVDYLIDGFKKFGFEKVIDYIVENYVVKDNVCLSGESEKMLNQRIEQAKKFPVGKTLPSYHVSVEKKGSAVLPAPDADKTLLLFYATWCPHCKEIIPKIYSDWKKSGKALSVFAIALDTKQDDWSGFIRQNCPDWNNACDLKGWDGELARQFSLYATPTMFLLDKSGTLLAKPVTYEEFTKALY